ncbi:npr-12 [Pristionchus pacificus]|uniref:Npr-12 n=1 Tax=Pristionchus pacificus TaxID=54126 RepID=A0A2A6CAR0_PRIPA|nr:npr-12 [Pristionchus pacificus]|eukprot:PDM75274.1 npr-12 [Pristionchus pacificus]
MNDSSLEGEIKWGSATPKWKELNCNMIDTIKSVQSEKYWENNDGFFFTIVYALICTFGAIANLTVLIVFARSSSLRNVRNSFIVNLAFSDLLLCTFTAPATLYLTLNLFWPLGNLTCQVLAAIQALNTFVSSLTLAMIAVDRVLLTLSPLKWRMANRAPLICYLILWLISLLVALPYSLAVHAAPVDFNPWDRDNFIHLMSMCRRPVPVMCQERKDSSWESPFISKLSYTLVVLAIQYLLPLFALGFAYIQIGSTIRKRGKTSTTVDEARRLCMQQKNRKALVLLVILVATYAFCWAPVNVYNVLAGLQLIQFSQYRYLFMHFIGISSACINPITYALVNDSFRDAASLMICPRSHRSAVSTNSKRTVNLTKRVEVDSTNVGWKRDEFSYFPPPSQTDSLL